MVMQKVVLCFAVAIAATATPGHEVGTEAPAHEAADELLPRDVPPQSNASVAETVTCEVLEEEGAVRCNGTTYRKGEELAPRGSRDWWRYLLSATACVLTAAFAAGLTLGMTSLDVFTLKVLCNRTAEDVEETDPDVRSAAQTKLHKDQQCARKLMPLLSGHYFGDRRCSRLNPSNGHCLLVTLLLANAAANEALPLFLDRLVPSWLAIILSVTVVLLFGEIVPSAIFTGPNQLRLAAAMTPAVRVVRLVLLPLVLPISLVLDWFLGHGEEEEHSRAEMKAMARTLQAVSLEKDEVSMIQGVLEMHHKTARDISKPLEKAKMLAHDDVISATCVQHMLEWGHSRLFVYRRDPLQPDRRDDIMGVLLVKKLVGVDLAEGRTVESLHQALKRPVVLGPDDNLLNALNTFQDGMCHLAVVSANSEGLADALDSEVIAPMEARPSMFCSLEDVIESMLQEDIFDEADAELGRCPVPGLPHKSTTSSSLFRVVGAGCAGFSRSTAAAREWRSARAAHEGGEGNPKAEYMV